MASLVVSEYVGARVRRKEDPRLITGSATYVDDVRLPGMLHVAVVRSMYAHARINGIDGSQAAAMPGVVGVYTGHDLQRFIAGEIKAMSEGEAQGSFRALATDRARYLGEPIAVVVAESAYAARDALDAVVVDYEPLPVVSSIEAAMQDGAPLLYDDKPGNIAVDATHTVGDVAGAFERAPVVVKQRIRSQRLSGVPMEPRAVAAAPDPATGGVIVWSSTQAPHWNRKAIAAALNLALSQVRVIAPEVGGGFGVKIGAYPEDLIVAALARMLKRPVKWIETRSEHFQVTNHGRAQIADIEVAADRNGKVLAYRLTVMQDQGADTRGSYLAPTTASMAVGCYDIPAVETRALGILTNTMPVAAYRGAGRPEAAYYIERAMDLVADATGLDPAEVRRVNFIPPDKFPVTTATGERYDTGEYAKALDKALEISGYQQLRQEQAAARQQGRYLGIGLATYVEICGFGPYESSHIRIEPSGSASVYTGISPHGQGQETTFAQIVADNLGVPFEEVVVHHGDTSNTPEGHGTMGSRGLAVGGGALMLSVEQLREKARRIAAHLLEASLDDIELADGKYRVKGAPDRGVTIREIAEAAYGEDLPEDLEPGLEATNFFRPADETFPFGAHVAVVEVLPETGEVKLLRYFSVDDCGVRISPMLVEGQVHGGLAQGIGQALLEEVRYDENGQLLTGTLMDYAIPKAHLFPFFQTDATVTPTPINPLGAKGIGEAATIGSTPAVANAVIDALEPFGITHLDIPFHSEKVWAAIRQSGK
ncbi:MAG: xanthine dehydrogenase family protein molybdopterin-binding subunit [Sphaerobacter sp.]|nr:xanthine dehydrogenase family protein molybdopterin-binding subunit [Sphaerobacter sp.]